MDIVNRSLVAHGGIEQWKALKSLSFTEKTFFYKEDGSLENEILQDQEFQFGKNSSMQIHSILDSVRYQLNVIISTHNETIVILNCKTKSWKKNKSYLHQHFM